MLKLGHLLGFILALAAVPDASASDKTWPAMREFQKSFEVVAGAEKIAFDLPLYDVKGTQQYLFTCRGGTDAYLDQLSDSTGENYVGNLMCSLILPGSSIEQTLLSEDESAAWFSRGQYHWDELVGDCGAYPEYGRLRHFMLRGFVLTLDAKQVKQDAHGKLASFTLQVSLKRDPSVKASQAEQMGYMRPSLLDPDSCKKILKGDGPRMCRDKSGSWIECPDGSGAR